MVQKHRSRPAGDGTTRKNDLSSDLITSESTATLRDHQARRLLVRFPITLAIAHLIAELHFATGGLA